MLVVLTAATVVGLSATPAFAGDEQPFGTLIVSGGGDNSLGGDWLQSSGVVSKGGVNVYANGDSGYVSNNYSSPAVGMKWQCVELVQRLFRTEGWTNDSNKLFGVNAVDIYGLGGRNLSSFPNDGRYVPVPGDLIVHSGGVGHVAVVNYISGTTVYVIEQNVGSSAEIDGHYGQASYTIGSTLALTRDQPVTGLPIEGIVRSGYNSNTNPGYSYNNGTVLHNLSSGALYVWAGGAKFSESSLPELSNLGYSTNYPGMKDVSDASLSPIPTVPVNGTVLRNTAQQIYVVAGGAKFVFASWAEYTGQGYGTSSYTNVPQTPLNAIGDAPGNMPKNGTVVDRPDGALFVIAGGVRWQFGTVPEYHSLGYSDSQIVYVSTTPLNGIYDASATHLPANETLLQGSDSTVWVMKSGQRKSFTSSAQFEGYGYSWSNIVRVPDSVLSGIPNGGNLP